MSRKKALTALNIKLANWSHTGAQRDVTYKYGGAVWLGTRIENPWPSPLYVNESVIPPFTWIDSDGNSGPLPPAT